MSGTRSTRRGRGTGSPRSGGHSRPGPLLRISKPGSARKRDRVSATLLPVPQDGGEGGDEDPLAQLKADIANLRGRHALVETTAAGWGEGRTAAPQSDYKPQRIGAHPPESLPTLRSQAAESVLSACGVPVSLVSAADGTSQREAWRRFVMGSVEPLLDIVGQEVERKLETRVTFDLSRLWAHDLAGRASSFKAMVTAGMEIERAAALSGLMTDVPM